MIFIQKVTGKIQIRICDDQKQVNWGIPEILNDDIQNKNKN